MLRELDAPASCVSRASRTSITSSAPRRTGDEQFAAALGRVARCRRCFADREDVAARARARAPVDRRRGAHGALRVLRARAPATVGADVVALGHTRDDQAETFLLPPDPRRRAARARRQCIRDTDRIVRPLLDCRRDELARGCRDAQATAALRRRRVERRRRASRATASAPSCCRCSSDRFNPAIVDVLADEADVARETWAWMEDAANEVAARHVVIAARPDAEPCSRARRRSVTPPAATAAAGRRVARHERARARTADWFRPRQRGAARRRTGWAERDRRDRDSAWNAFGTRLVLTGRSLDTAGRWNPANAGASRTFSAIRCLFQERSRGRKRTASCRLEVVSAHVDVDHSGSHQCSCNRG